METQENYSSRETSQSREPLILETDDSVSFLGVKVNKGDGGELVPDLKRFKGNVLTEYDYRLMQKIAVALSLNQPLLVESGSGFGKTTIIDYMGALLNTNVYYANVHNFDVETLIGMPGAREDTKSGFGWIDGLVLDPIRNGGILVLDEYNFMRGEVKARLHEILDAIIQGKGEIILTENNRERIKVHPDFRLVCLQNPPGKGYGSREVHDPAQLTRFVYLKEPDKLPKEVKKARALGFIDQDNEVNIGDREILYSSGTLVREQLQDIPGIREIIEKFVEFSEAVERMVQLRKIGQDQAQPLYFAFQRDFNRVMQFVMHFYSGDINETFQAALRYYYSNKLDSDVDKQKLEELIKLVEYVPPHNVSPRRGLDRSSTAVPERQRETIEVSQEQDAWSETLGTNVEVPPLPAEVTPEVQRNLERLGFELRYIPNLDIGTLDELQRNGQERFLDEIQRRYPNWRRYETLSSEEREDHRVGRNLEEWFWGLAKDGRMKLPQLPGTWVAVETMQKPSYGEHYDRTPVSERLGLDDRFNVSWDDAHRAIENNKRELLSEIGLPSSDDVRMLEAVEWNLLANREGWGSTNTYEWTNTEARGDGESSRVIVGDSYDGGAARVSWYLPAYSADGVGFRVAIVLGT